jgi:DNA-binding NarL/FixJ family response regulator
MSARMRIVIVDDHPIVLLGLRNLVAAEPDFDLIAEASSGAAGLSLIRTERPDLAIIDISMADISGISLAQQLKQENSSVQILAMTVHEDRAYVSAALEAGIRGYVLKRSVTESLIPAIRAVLAGAIFIDQSIVAPMLAPQPSAKPRKAGLSDGVVLTNRESEVLKLVASGLSNKQIAAELGIGIKSVETYRARGFDKLRLRTRADIVRYGLAHGWLSP